LALALNGNLVDVVFVTILLLLLLLMSLSFCCHRHSSVTTAVYSFLLHINAANAANNNNNKLVGCCHESNVMRGGIMDWPSQPQQQGRCVFVWETKTLLQEMIRPLMVKREENKGVQSCTECRKVLCTSAVLQYFK
jgi:hypothetical protein